MTGTNAAMMRAGVERLDCRVLGLFGVLALLVRAHEMRNALRAAAEPTTALVPSCSRLPAVPQFSSSDDD